jgi:isopentenyldiphosphate isomerase
VSADERIDIVVDDDRVVGESTRAEMRTRGLRHRCVYVLLFNPRNQLYVHRRTATKDVYPSYYDVAFGGVVTAGESYAAAAQRELEEEAGVRTVRLRRALTLRYDDEHNHVNGALYTATWDGPVRLQASEIQHGEWMDLDAVFDLAQHEPFCPDGLEALCRYLDLLNQAQQAGRD